MSRARVLPRLETWELLKHQVIFLFFADSHLDFRKGWGLKILDRLKENETSIITPTIFVIGDDNSRASGFRWKNIDMEMERLPDLKSEIHEVPFACGCCMAI